MKWNRYNPEIDNFIYYLNEDDKVIYAREQTEGGYLKSETNQLIFNIKKPLQNNGQKYKIEAINRFASELSVLNFPENCIFIPDPTSKTKNDINYDNRLLKVLSELKKDYPLLKIEEPISLKESVVPSHSGGSRDPTSIMQNFIWNGFSWQCSRKYSNDDKFLTIIYIDDMLTSGAHYRAYTDFLIRHYPNCEIYGVFWARRVQI